MESFEEVKFAFLEPSSTLPTIVEYRSILLPIIANIVDEMIDQGPHECERSLTIRVSLAMLKALILIPDVVGREVISYFSVFPAPSHLCIGDDNIDRDVLIDHTNVLFDCAESMLLALCASNELCDLWQWYDIVPLLKVTGDNVRWYAMKSMGLVLGVNMAPFSVNKIFIQENEMVWKESLAKYQIYRNAFYSSEFISSDSHSIFPKDFENIEQSSNFSRRYIVEQNFVVAKREGWNDVSEEYQQFHPTSDQRNILKKFALALSANSKSIVFDGPASSGKTSIINFMASRTGNYASMVRVHLDDQVDSKTLLGGYVCTAKPGEFVWSPGPVVRALQNGRWLVLENVNLASSEVVTMISSLARTGSVEIPSRGETITAKAGFQLITTCTLFPGRIHGQILEKMLFPCSIYIQLDEICSEDQKMILAKLYPPISPLAAKAVMIIELLTQASWTQHNMGYLEGMSRQLGGDGCFAQFKAIIGKMDRVLTFRDVIKWADRMMRFHSEKLAGIDGIFQEYAGDISRISLSIRESAFTELADCTSLSASSPVIKQKVLNIIALSLYLPDSVVENYIRLAKPSVSSRGGTLHIGRASIQLSRSHAHNKEACLSSSFAQTGAAMRLMERLSVSIVNNEPILLVGETGVGKTTVIQEIAKISAKKFSVINLSQQTDSSDLIGGFRPRIPGEAVMEIVPEFIDLVKDTWKRGDNEEFISRVLKLAAKKKWSQLLKAYKAAINKWLKTSQQENPNDSRQGRGTKRRRHEDDNSTSSKWESFRIRVKDLDEGSSMMERGFVFGFSEGLLVKAFQQGWWLLLDEINLAPTEVLERIAGILDSSQGWVLTERGDEQQIGRHPEFRIFAAMNPATDSGKKSLSALVRDRFTEFWVEEPSDTEDLMTIVSQHLGPLRLQVSVESIVGLYTAVKQESLSTFQDGSGIRPIYNLRTLVRALEYARRMSDMYGIRRALVDGFCMSFQTQLDVQSSMEFTQLVSSYLLTDGMSLSSVMRVSPERPSPRYVQFDDFWIESGGQEILNDSSFIITPAVMANLRNLARAVLLKKYPILLQGPTSSGKTSLISHLAAATGHTCIRINNHEHTDLQDYIGCYMSDSHGRLVFNEGPLIQALRKGYWVILDELNLAPSEVLEALNRLLDDNRELFVPELQEIIAPHRHFMLFATQNPPGIYAGRKNLSRAFRSRFLEIHVDNIPDEELHEIVEKKCSIAPSYSKRMISVMRELQRRRSVTNLFAGKHGYITPRDLFRWANRPAVSYQELAVNGYFVLAERLRDEADRQVVLSTLEKILKTKIPLSAIYLKIDDLALPQNHIALGSIVWTHTFQRIFSLIYHCLENSEPALLVGETGIGKTTACQLLAQHRKQELHILNCNHHTETSDFIGGYRPNRRRGAICRQLREATKTIFPDLASIQSDIEFVDKLAKYAANNIEKMSESTRHSLLAQVAAFNAPFEWIDGPLIQAMRNGDILLIDEINLADDAVLERLNSVLESSKTITLAEKSGPKVETIISHPSFQIIATMNPGGDFGKKELSPALMNRFTSFWVPALKNGEELSSILEKRLNEPLRDLSGIIVDFWRYFESNIAARARQNLSVRDILCVVDFVNSMFSRGLEKLDCLVQGIEMVAIDGLGLGSGVDKEFIEELQSQLKDALANIFQEHYCLVPEVHISLLERTKDRWGISPFFIGCSDSTNDKRYNFETKTSRKNLFRILRAMQLDRPVLLEGSPGVGKTTLVEAMCQAVGQRFVRINLSDQTDMMDLLGANLPSPDGSVGEFVWFDGPLIQAMQSGSWVLLDELNLANQSILEGLNALLDHRGEIYIPELDTTITCKRGFRLFAAQNPIQEGGGRKGLPRSFLNRFIRVRINGFCYNDLVDISGSIYPMIPRSVVKNLTNCVLECSTKGSYDNQDAVDFNLRDLLRWCQLISEKLGPRISNLVVEQASRWARYYGTMLFSARMRSSKDFKWMENILDKCLCQQSLSEHTPILMVDPGRIILGNAEFDRCTWSDMLSSPPLNAARQNVLLKSFFRVQETLLECVRNKWLGILVGDIGSGKSSCILNLASLLGKKVQQVQIHEGTDTSDLLGGFEQVDLVREGTLLATRIKKFLQQLATLLVCDAESLVKLAKLSQNLFHGSCGVDLDHLRHVVQTVLDNVLPLSGFIQDGNSSLYEDFSRLEFDGKNFLRRSNDIAGKFEWVDGTLTNCILDGSWVILRDANLCNPSVLDRLNPLFEPGGFISLNECGSTTEGPRMVLPHSEFRLFITYDSRSGEISRAMRNRGIEINVSWRNRLDLTNELTKSPVPSDLVSFVSNHSIPRALSECLGTFWANNSVLQSKDSLQYLSNWANMIHNLVCRGVTVKQAISLSFEQVFKCKIPCGSLDVGFCKNMVVGDPTIFTHPQIVNICQSSALDVIFSDWGFIVEVCQSFNSNMDNCEIMAFFREQGPFAAMCHAALLDHERDSEHQVFFAGLHKEDVFNASMAIFVGEENISNMRAKFLLRMIEEYKCLAFGGSLRRQVEISSWKMLFSDILNSERIKLNSESVRFILERYRLRQLIHVLPENFEQCESFLESLAWCVERPFSQENSSYSELMKWMWAAMENLYDLQFESLERRVVDALSLLRRLLMSQGSNWDMEILSYAWHRLIKTLERSCSESKSSLPEHCERLNQKVSSILLGEEQGIHIFTKFFDLVGKPLVALNFELHQILIEAMNLADEACVHAEELLLYREDKSGKNSNIIMLAGQPSVRHQLLETLQIFFAGSLVDVNATSHMKDMLIQLSSLIDNLKIKASAMTKKNIFVDFVDFDTAFEQLDSLNDIILRQMETESVLGIAWEYMLNGTLDVAKVSHMVDLILEQTVRVSSRQISRALPFQAFSTYSNVLVERIDNAGKIRSQKGISNMILLQMHQNIWSPYLYSDGKYVTEGLLPLHTCAFSVAVSKIAMQGVTPLKQRECRLHQIECCISCIALSERQRQGDSLSVMEWKSAMILLSMVVNSISESIPLDVPIFEEIDATDLLNHIRLNFDKILEKIDSAQDIDRLVADALKKSLRLLVFDELVMLPDGMLQRGKAMSLLSLVQLKFSTPQALFDPGLVGKFESQFLEFTMKHFYENEMRVRSMYSDLPLARSQVANIGIIQEQMKQLKEEIKQISDDTPARPEVSQYLSMKEYINNFLSHMASFDRITKIIEEVESFDPLDTNCNPATLWIENTNSFISSLNKKYPCYRDVFGPLELSLRGIQYGISLMSTWSSLQGPSSDDISIVQNLLTSQFTGKKISSDPRLERILYKMDKEGREDYLFQRLRFCDLAIKELEDQLRHSSLSRRISNIYIDFTNIVEKVHEIWDIVREDENLRVAEEQSSFEIKSRQLQISKDEFSAKIEIATFFQDSSWYYEVHEGDATLSSVSDPREIESQSHTQKVDFDLILIRLLNVFYSLTLKDSTDLLQNQKRLTDTFRMGIGAMENFEGLFPRSLDQHSMPGFLLMLCEEHEILTNDSSKTSMNDIYSPNIQEVSRLRVPIENILERVGHFLLEWPDHPVLEQLSKIGNKILDLSLNSSLKIFLTGVELMLSRAQLWDETAARHVALTEHLKPLISLAIFWRKLELDGWKNLLLKVREDAKKEAYMSFLHIFGIVNSEVISMTEFINILDSFIRDSSVGQFSERLKIMRAFAIYLDQGVVQRGMIQQSSTISNIFNNLDRYYSQFSDCVDDCINREMMPLEKDLSDFVSLAKWEDKGFYAMKASSDKAHTHLYKIVKKAKEILQKSCSPCLVAATQSIGIGKRSKHYCSKTGLLLESLSRYPIPISLDIKSYRTLKVSLGKYSGRIEKVSKKFIEMLKLKSEVIQQIDNAIRNVDTLACSALLKGAELKDDSMKGAKARKKKALSDLFKALESYGISRLQSRIPSIARYSHYWIMQTMPCPDYCPDHLKDGVDRYGLWEVGDSYYYKSVARLMKLDQVSKTPHQDIQQREAQLSRNLGVSLMFIIQRVRHIISNLSNIQASIDKSIHVMKSAQQVSLTREPQLFNVLHEAMSSCISVNSKYTKYFEVLSKNKIESLPWDKIKLLSKLIGESQAILVPLKDRLDLERVKTIELDDSNFCVTETMNVIFEKIVLSMDVLSRAIIENCSADIPGVGFLEAAYSELSMIISTQRNISVADQEIGSELDLELATAYEDITRACMTWAQNVPQEDGTPEGDDISFLVPLIERLLSLSNVQNMVRKSARLAQLVEKMARCNHPLLSDAQIMVSQVLPLMTATTLSMNNFLLHVSVLHRGLTKMSYISLEIFCDLLEKGFCVQEENVPGEDEEIRDGTGLGEGETAGANDISDQLQNQDQILGADVDGQEEQRDEENICEDEKAHGIEMENDFDGKMDDVEPQEEEVSEDDEDMQELDRQMGETNDADIVDERLWDNEDEELGNKEAEDKSKSRDDMRSAEYAKGDEHNSDDNGLDQEHDIDEGDKMNDSTKPEDEDMANEENNPEDIENEDNPSEEIDTGFLEQEKPCEEIDLPEDMNLDEMDANLEEFPDEDGMSSEEGDINSGDPQPLPESGSDMEADDTVPATTPEDIQEETMDGTFQEDMDEKNHSQGLEGQTGAGLDDPTTDNQPGNPDEDVNTGDKPDVNDTGKQAQAGKKSKTEVEEKGMTDINPFRSVQDAVEQWKSKNAIDVEISEDDDPDIGKQGNEQGQDDLRFVREEEMPCNDDENILANANEDQAQHATYNEHEDPEEKLNREDSEIEEKIEDAFTRGNPTLEPNTEEETERSAVLDAPREMKSKEMDSVMADNNPAEANETKLQLDEMIFGDLSLTERNKKSLRATLDKKIHTSDLEVDIDYGREVWSNCELLTAHLSSELAEQIRLILEPTAASKLGGEYVSGKRINMKRVIEYIASHFKKDKIWMRRTQPNKRRYQVLVAIDDSRSMAETACGAFALESLTLICNAMSKIEIGDLGVIRFGGSIGAELVHPLGHSFSSGDGAKIMSKMKFDADNTINDTPMVEVLESINSILDDQSKELSHSAVLQQLVIILADGRFHEKGNLKKAAMDVTSRPGVMYAFIVLDSPQNSILDMQSVSFGPNGKPSFSKYIDSFPFPLYTVLQDIQYLPKALSHLLRQWIEFTTSS